MEIGQNWSSLIINHKVLAGLLLMILIDRESYLDCGIVMNAFKIN